MENNNKKKQFIISMICIMLLILFSVGMVYAFFNYTRVGERNNVLNTANLNFSFEDSEWIWLENAFPITTEEALTLEKGGNSDITEVDGGIAGFTITGGHNSGAIHYYVSLVNEELTETITSKNNRYTLDPSTKSGKLPDGAISINLQTSISNIHENTGLVDNINDMLNPGKSFEPSYTGSYINTQGSVTIDKLPIENSNERIIGTGIMSGNVSTRYFELRMWINDSVLLNDELRAACLISTSSADVNTYGVGYCNPSTSNLPDGIKYVYSSGEFGKLYYSNKIKVQTTDVTNGLVDSMPSLVKAMTTATTPSHDTDYTNLFIDITDTYGNFIGHSGLIMMDSTQNSPYPIYYYRGVISNNYLLFGGFCWKIVRTTETGGVKIIYSGNNNTCNEKGATISSGKYNENKSYISAVSHVYKTPSLVYDVYNSIDATGNVIFGGSATYQNGQYTLQDTMAVAKSSYSSAINSGLNYRHYTCLDGGSSCSTVKFVYESEQDGIDYLFKYVELNSGMTPYEALDITLNNDGTLNNSTINNTLNTWYEDNLSSYSTYLEDTVFCVDRTIYDYGGWDNNKSNYYNALKFGFNGRAESNTPTLACPKSIDKFTVNSWLGNGLLKYPIGLLTADEYMFAGAKGNEYGYSKQHFLVSNDHVWTITPNKYSVNANVYTWCEYGYLQGIDVQNIDYIRPVVSLNKNVKVSGGNGTINNPYTISL